MKYIYIHIYIYIYIHTYIHTYNKNCINTRSKRILNGNMTRPAVSTTWQFSLQWRKCSPVQVLQSTSKNNILFPKKIRNQLHIHETQSDPSRKKRHNLSMSCSGAAVSIQHNVSVTRSHPITITRLRTLLKLTTWQFYACFSLQHGIL